MNIDFYMNRCLELAKSGMGNVAPNPMVGCVIVKDGEIISEGWHKEYGGPHAEVNAINQLPADFDFSQCSLFVNLEPCSHFGKTPPCSNLIIEKKFKEIFIANLDTNPLVAGKGIEKLKNAGINVTSKILEKEARELNKRFFTFHEKKRPYVILKWAETKDGFISKLPVPASIEENWITSADSKKLAHQWRAEEQAILVGANTVINDDPELTVRLSLGKNPTRIIIDKDLSLSKTHKVFNNTASVFVINEKATAAIDHIHYIKTPFNNNFINSLLSKLFEHNIQSVIIEGGAKTLRQFIDSNNWDEARVFIGEKLFEQGIKAPQLNFKREFPVQVGTDSLFIIQNS